MRLHPEGRTTLMVAGFAFCVLALLVGRNMPYPLLMAVLLTACIVIYGLLLNFFRNPVRTIPQENSSWIYAPADGKVVAIEETEEQEYFKDRRIQVSIFMSPLNVHVNRCPIPGTIAYQKYHSGKYLVAFHPKSSTENERNTVVIDQGRYAILVRQIAGALARRIVCYTDKDDVVTQGQEFGFIKFGSRVDTFLPTGTDIKVKIGDKVIGNKTVIGMVDKFMGG
jgi:phosphatidylserine decarboxylase